MVDTLETSGSACLVLMDNFHVSMEAHQLLEELRARPELRRRVKIIGLAAVPNWPPKDSELASEIDAYLPLPFAPDDLLAKVEAASQQLQDGV